jgi:hypothetical protein
MCYIDGQKNKYSVLNECNRMLKYNILKVKVYVAVSSPECKIGTKTGKGYFGMVRIFENDSNK